MSELKINTERLELFVEALSKVPEQNVSMPVGIEPNPICGTPGCHAGLIMQAAEFLPALGEIYIAVCLEKKCPPEKYFFLFWRDALSLYLMDSAHFKALERWAKENPKDWGSGDYHMFISEGAFGKGTGEQFPHTVILTRWGEVLQRLKYNKAYSELSLAEKVRKRLGMVR